MGAGANLSTLKRWPIWSLILLLFCLLYSGLSLGQDTPAGSPADSAPEQGPVPAGEGVNSPPAALAPPDLGKGEDADQWWLPFINPAISALAGLAGAAVGGFVARWNMSASNNQRANEIEINQLQAKLNGFYGPFCLISDENKIIALEFKKKQGKEDFRTLIALLDPDWRTTLSPANKTIVATMIENGRALRTLVREKAALVDPKVQPYFAKAAAHFAILELASKGELENDPARFAQYVYPEKLDGVIDLEVRRLTGRIDYLLANSDRRNERIAPLKIPADLAL